ncbi:hypothetical protein H4I95_06637 [Botrytis cinerea]
MFVAKFDPPVVVPYAIAMQIYQSTQTPFDFSEITTFDGLMFPLSAEEALKTNETQARTINVEKNVSVWDREGKKEAKQHFNTLYIEKIDYGRKVEEVSFSHPRQLVEMLPCLRQFALLSTVLRKSFEAEERSKSKSRGPSKSEPLSKSSEIDTLNPPTKKQEFEDFMKGIIATPTSKSVLEESKKEKKGESTHLDVSLTLTPVPRVEIVFEFKKRSANVIFEIQGNGRVVVAQENILNGMGEDEVMDGMGEEGKARTLTSEDLGRMLEVCEDLGVWVEWIKGRL